jgi:tetratricopeptide (TPR) repeat protein/O-antigen ligase
MNFVSYCNRIIEYSFYVIFFFVPLFFLGNTSELFELNKMWVVFGLTIVIGVCWIFKIIAQRRIAIRRTPLDIAIAMFVVSQFISTIFSLDPHVSWWGYYSRFNGGLYSTLCYVFLYYAFVSNLEVKHVLRVLNVSLVSGLITALWGFPSHYGYDPTCFVFRGTLDTNCWTEAFRPTIRAFSTLGQPAWFAAYLDILLPLSMAYTLIGVKQKKIKTWAFGFALTVMFYACLIFANTRAGTDAFYAVAILFWIVVFYKRIFATKILLRYFAVFLIGVALCNFVFGTPASSIDFIKTRLSGGFVAYAQTEQPAEGQQVKTKGINITDSWDIRMIVWRGAIAAWQANPLFGTGVETFAFAYYKYRPAEHNLTSEWDYLYNKAHNEYLNYLTTSGIFGLGSYLLFIGLFVFYGGFSILKKKNTGASNRAHSSTHVTHETKHIDENKHILLSTGLLCGWTSILLTNFSGFSVVIVNLYFFLIPLFLFFVMGTLTSAKYEFSFGESHKAGRELSFNWFQWVLLVVVFLFGANMILGLLRYWYADTVYALGTNLDRASAYQEGFPLLKEAVTIVPTEPVYADEYSVNLATLAEALYLNNEASAAGQFANEAIAVNTQLVTNHPNNIIFWKNRLRIFYSLANGDPQNSSAFYSEALTALKKSRELAPTDAKIAYNQGVLLGQTGNMEEGARVLEETIRLKPDYYDAYVALGLLYHQLAVNPSTPPTSSPSADLTVINPEMKKKAVETYEYILENLSPENEEIRKVLEEWNKSI